MYANNGAMDVVGRFVFGDNGLWRIDNLHTWPVSELVIMIPAHLVALLARN